MLGQMQNHPLLISSVIDFAARHQGDTEVVSRRVEGDIHRYTWADVQRRAKQVAKALDALGVKVGERVGTLAWNGYRHLELYFGVSGSGRVKRATPPWPLPFSSAEPSTSSVIWPSRVLRMRKRYRSPSLDSQVMKSVVERCSK